MDEPITVVSGLPRSGTSLMMQMLAAGGLPILSDDFRAADASNPRGYFEFAPVKRLRADQSWLEQAQGRAVKIIYLLLRELPIDGRFAYRVLLMQRPVEEVIASQRAMLERESKPSADATALRNIYQNQMAETERWLATHACFATCAVSYHDLVRDAAGSAATVNGFLGGALDVPAMAAAVDPSLHRQRS